MTELHDKNNTTGRDSHWLVRLVSAPSRRVCACLLVAFIWLAAGIVASVIKSAEPLDYAVTVTIWMGIGYALCFH